jgi:hypothetical protein
MEQLGTLRWRKARASGANGGGCVEIGTDDRTPVVHVRDTKSRERGMITVSAATWRQFMNEIKAGRADLPRLSRKDSPRWLLPTAGAVFFCPGGRR